MGGLHVAVRRLRPRVERKAADGNAEPPGRRGIDGDGAGAGIDQSIFRSPVDPEGADEMTGTIGLEDDGLAARVFGGGGRRSLRRGGLPPVEIGRGKLRDGKRQDGNSAGKGEEACDHLLAPDVGRHSADSGPIIANAF